MEQTKYDVFISYSRKDYLDEKGNVIPGNEVTKIIDALKEAGISFWYDQEGNMHGKDFGAEILKYIKASKIFIFLSTAAANDSEWTRREIACALEYMKKKIPVRIDASRYHDSVMFRIADLDYIKYGSNPKKGREELVDAIKYYMAEEKAAAVRREAEEQRRREEQERQHRQQEELRRKQQQADELRAEINKTEEECTSLEKTLMLKKHDLDVVNLELDAKRKHLEEQKNQMNSILYEDNATPEPPSPVPSFVQKDYEGFIFCWRHPLNSLREMWGKIMETMALRHWIVNVFLWIFVISAVLAFIIFTFGNIETAPSYCALFGLTAYALVQLLLNKRASVGFFYITPFLVLFLVYFNHLYCDYYRNDYYMTSNVIDSLEDMIISLPTLSVIISITVFPFLLIRKGGKSARSLLEGKRAQALQINKHPIFYLLFLFLLFATPLYFISFAAY